MGKTNMKDVFTDLRATYFTLNRASHFPIPSNATEPWGVIMEIAYPQAIVTTVTFADGTVSVLRSSGGGFFGGGDESVQSAGKAFLKQAQLIQPQATLTNDFPAPNVGRVVFYLRTDGGIYTISATENDMKQQNHPLFQFYCTGLRILHEYLKLQKQVQK
jgi:hypothetical protein